jgi:hypothetical protein
MANTIDKIAVTFPRPGRLSCAARMGRDMFTKSASQRDG